MVTAGEPEARRLAGRYGILAAVLAAGLSLYAIYWVLFIVQPQVYRVSFLLLALILIFLSYSYTGRRDTKPNVVDWVLIAAAVGALMWPLVDFDRFIYRAADPLPIDVALGAVTIALVLEAARRTVGWILPFAAVMFLLYGWAGPAFDRIGLTMLAHRGYALDRLVGTLYVTLEGIFGVPLDVAATYIILFTLYGAVLEQSGAGRFFIDWAPIRPYDNAGWTLAYQMGVKFDRILNGGVDQRQQGTDSARAAGEAAATCGARSK